MCLFHFKDINCRVFGLQGNWGGFSALEFTVIPSSSCLGIQCWVSIRPHSNKTLHNFCHSNSRSTYSMLQCYANKAEHRIQPHYVVSMRREIKWVGFSSKAYLNGSLMMLKFHWGSASGAEWIQEKIKSFIDPTNILELFLHDVLKVG